MNKKIMITALTISLLFSLTSCGDPEETEESSTTASSVTEVETTDVSEPTTTESTPTLTVTPAETPVETTETPTETEQSGEVNPDDFWDTGEDGRPLFHIDEYAEALGYVRRYRTPGTFIIECGPDYILYSCLINKFQYASEEEPIVTYEWGGEDSNQIWVEYNDHIGLCGEGKIYDMIAALETFSNYEYTPGVAPEAPNGWVADYENDDWIF